MAYRVPHSDLREATGNRIDTRSFNALASFLRYLQSPIDIVPSNAKTDLTLTALKISYSEDCVKSIANTGNSWKADVDDGKASAFNYNLTMQCVTLKFMEPLIFSSERRRAGENIFRLIQFHAHWGSASGAKGSEHTVDGRLYDAEVR